MRKYLPWGLGYLVIQALLIAQFDVPWRVFLFPSANFLVIAFGLEFFRPKAEWTGFHLRYASGTHAVVSRMSLGLAVLSYAISIMIPFLRLV